MSWLYLSHRLNRETPSYGGGPSLQIESLSSLDRGDSSNSSRWSFKNHLGTHIDAPYHFSSTGATLDTFAADFWHFARPIGVSCPVEASGLITQASLEPLVISQDMDLLLVKTGFEKHRPAKTYWEENPGFHPEAALWLRQTFPRLRAVGMDFISVSRWQDRSLGRQAHHNFLSPRGDLRPLLLIEDMSLQEISEQPLKEVWALPLRVQGCDGAPCTVVGRIGD